MTINLIHSNDLARDVGYSSANSAFREWCARIRLTRNHVEPTPEGQRIKLRTNKKGRTAAIPVTAGMQSILERPPPSNF